MGINAFQSLARNKGGQTARAAVLATWSIAGLVCGAQPVLHDVDAVALRWSQFITASGTVFETESFYLEPGAYRLTLQMTVAHDDVAPSGSIWIQACTTQGVLPAAAVAIPLPAATPAVVRAQGLLYIAPDKNRRVSLRIFSTADVSLTCQQLELRRRPFWWRAAVWLAGAPAYGQASLRMSGVLNTEPPWYRYPVVAGTNSVLINASWPWLELCGQSTRAGSAIALSPCDPSVQAVVHHLAVRPDTRYCMQVAVRGGPFHPAEDRLHIDCYSALPLYDPAEADLIVNGAELKPDLCIYDHYFRTAETPPAIMMRIMAALSSPITIEWITLKELSSVEYALHRMKSIYSKWSGQALLALVILVVCSTLVWCMEHRWSTVRLASIILLCGIAGSCIMLATSAHGHVANYLALNVLAASMFVLVLGGWWLMRMYAWGTDEPVLSCAVTALGLAWLTCGLYVANKWLDVRTALVAVLAVSMMLSVSTHLLQQRRAAYVSDHRDIVAGVTLMALVCMITLLPYGHQALRGFFSECIDGFMYTAAADYLRDTAYAQREWNTHALLYVQQVLYTVKRLGICLLYAAVNDTAGVSGAISYRIWQVCLHASLAVMLFCIARAVGIRRWAAWVAGCLAACIPVAQLPVFGNSLAQSAGLLLLVLLALSVALALEKKLRPSGYLVTGVHVALALAALWTVYRELLIYPVGTLGIYAGICLVHTSIATQRRRLVFGILLTVLAALAGGVFYVVDSKAIVQHVHTLITTHFPYFDAGDIRVRLSPLHAAGGLDVMYAAGYTRASVLWPPLGAACALITFVLMGLGLVRLRHHTRYAALAVVMLCVALYVVLGFMFPWPYALKKHLSVCALGGAVLAGAGVDWLLKRMCGWRALCTAAAVTVLLIINVLLVWNMLAYVSKQPHYFDDENEYMRNMIHTHVPRTARIYVDTNQRIEAFFYTLPMYAVYQSDPHVASHALVRRDRMQRYRDMWLGQQDAHERLAESAHYLLLRNKGGQ